MDASAPLPEASEAASATGPVRGLFAALLEALHTRLELAEVELEIHLRALLRSLIWAVSAVACALLGGTLLFIVLAAIFGYLGARALRTRSGALEGSFEQLAEDERRARGDP